MPENMQQNQQQPKRTIISDEMLARRRLLKLGAYVPPAVLGMMIIGGMPTPAQAVVGSCCPSACQPCISLTSGVGEEGKPLNRKQCNKKVNKCNKKRAKLKKGCGAAPNPCRGLGGGGGERGG
ncbi:MAG: hypothetical protein Q9M24_04770 [Mariprofundaceae bacterium]|nr:hypothetical protein [Mariprofundaceae bacterium]